MAAITSESRLPPLLIAAGSAGFIGSLALSPAFRAVFESTSDAESVAAIEDAGGVWTLTWIALGTAVMVVAVALLLLARANAARTTGTVARLWEIGGLAAFVGSALYGIVVAVGQIVLAPDAFVDPPLWLHVAFYGFNAGMITALACHGTALWRSHRRLLASWMLFGVGVHVVMVLFTPVLPLTYYAFFFVVAVGLLVRPVAAGVDTTAAPAAG